MGEFSWREANLFPKASGVFSSTFSVGLLVGVFDFVPNAIGVFSISNTVTIGLVVSVLESGFEDLDPELDRLVTATFDAVEPLELKAIGVLSSKASVFSVVLVGKLETSAVLLGFAVDLRKSVSGDGFEVLDPKLIGVLSIEFVFSPIGLLVTAVDWL